MGGYACVRRVSKLERWRGANHVDGAARTRVFSNLLHVGHLRGVPIIQRLIEGRCAVEHVAASHRAHEAIEQQHRGKDAGVSTKVWQEQKGITGVGEGG